MQRIANRHFCIYNVSTFNKARDISMLVEIQKWGNSAAVRVPASALKEAGLQIGQRLDLKTGDGRLVLEPAKASLDELVARITPENCHGLALDDEARGNEAW
jgi:antitoxin MazE